MSNNTQIQWFTEAILPHSSSEVKISIAYTKKLYDEKNEFGHIEVFDTLYFGRLLTIDGIVQVSESDEFIYHEMMVGLPSLYHGKPENILIIGGGDGGAVKMALQIPSIKKITLVEIDRSVMDVCLQYLPKVSGGSLDNPKVEVVIADGLEYVKTSTQKFDVISLDLTDPIPDSPAEALFGEDFYNDLKSLLTENGIVATHCGSLMFQPEEAAIIAGRLKKAFKNVNIHIASIPTYQFSIFGFLYASNSNDFSVEDAVIAHKRLIQTNLQYLSEDMVKASAVLPPYLINQLNIGQYVNNAKK